MGAERGAVGSHSAMVRKTPSHGLDMGCIVGYVIRMNGTVKLPRILVDDGMNTRCRQPG